jgi:hypothetical protein
VRSARRFDSSRRRETTHDDGILGTRMALLLATLNGALALKLYD